MDCAALPYTLDIRVLAGGNWLDVSSTSPPYSGSTVSYNAPADLFPGETMELEACFVNDGISACANPVYVAAPSVAACSGGGGSGGGGGSSSGGGSRKPVLE